MDYRPRYWQTRGPGEPPPPPPKTPWRDDEPSVGRRGIAVSLSGNVLGQSAQNPEEQRHLAEECRGLDSELQALDSKT